MTETASAHSPRTAAPRPARMAAIVLAAIIAAVLPALAGLVLLGSAALSRPLLARWARTPGPAQARLASRNRAAGIRLTVAWGIGLLLVGLAQGLVAVTAGAPLTDPAGMITRTLIGVVGEALLAIATLAWLRRSKTSQVRSSFPAPPGE